MFSNSFTLESTAVIRMPRINFGAPFLNSEIGPVQIKRVQNLRTRVFG